MRRARLAVAGARVCLEMAKSGAEGNFSEAAAQAIAFASRSPRISWALKP